MSGQLREDHPGAMRRPLWHRSCLRLGRPRPVIVLAGHRLLDDRPLLVVGFTDPRGPSAYNYTLGLDRARSVARYLIRRGVPTERLVLASRGELLALGDSPETWFYDRRVEISLLP